MRNEIRALLIAAGTVGCTTDGGATADTPAYTVRDSAGIEIVESVRPQWTDSTAWRISDNPIATIGIDDGDAPYLLYGVTGALRLRDGRIVLIDQGSAQLRFYDANGRFLHATGRKGNGPGEFARPEHLVRMRGDSLAVWDAGFRPVSVFTADGEFVRQHRVNVERVMATLTMGRATEALTPLSDGSFIVHATQRGDPHTMGVPPGEVFRSQIGFYRFHEGGVDSLGWFAGGLPQMYLDIGGRPVYATVLRPWHVRLAASADGRRVFIAEGGAYEIAEYSDGRLIRAIRRRSDPVPIPQEALDAAREQRWSAPDEWVKDMRRVQDALPPQTHWYAISSMRVDTEGDVWVITPGEGTHVFDTAGRWLGAIEVPGSILDVGRDYVLIRQHDPLGVERVEMYALRR